MRLPARLILTSIVLWLPSGTVLAADVVVVCPPSFDDSLRPWLDDRRQRPLDVAVVRPVDAPEDQRSAIDAHVDDSTTAILLVGDAPVRGQSRRRGEVPTFERPTTVTGEFHSTPTLATDRPYAGDRDIAVGRLPVRSAAELTIVVDKILASDRSDDFGPWRGRVELVGGVGGFGILVDAAIESVARTVITSSLPTATRTGVLFGSPGHPFYPRDQSFRDAVLERYRRGCRFWVYAGHGQVTSLDHVPPLGTATPGPPVLEASSFSRLARLPERAPIALMLACFNGAMDAPPRCVAETMLTHPGGPVAVIAGSRVTMPYGNSKLATALIDAVYREECETLGQAWSRATGQMVAPEERAASAIDGLIDGVATLMHGDAGVADEERIEHASLYGLFGDPTMRLHPPNAATIEVSGDALVNQPIRFSVESPIDGVATVSLDRVLGSTGGGPDPNDVTMWSGRRSIATGGPTPLASEPVAVPGWYVLRLHVAGSGGWAVAGKKFFVRDGSR